MGKGKAHSANIYAIALAMHGVHNVQEKVTVPNKVGLKDTKSVYGLIKDGLIKAQKVELGLLSLGELTEYEKTVYDYQDDAIALLQARYNAMLTLAIARLSNIKDSTIKGLFNIYLGLPRTFKSRFTQMSIGKQYQTNVYLDGGVEVKEYLEELGIKPVLIKPLKRLYGKMIIEDENVTNDSDVVVAAA